MSDNYYIFVDGTKAKNEIQVGTRVHLWGEPEETGTVISLEDPDGDVDDYGRPYSIPGKVEVKFDKPFMKDRNGEDVDIDEFPGRLGWYDEALLVDDLEVILNGEQ